MSTAASNTRAALLVTAAMAAFCVNDAVIKSLSVRVPIGELMAVRGLMAILLMLAVLPWLGLRVGPAERFTWLRAAGEVGVTFAFLAALTRLPLGETYTLYFVGPILLTAGAALVFGETVGPRRWLAVIVGFLGVLVVLGLPSSWQMASGLALGAALLSAIRDLATRRIPANVGSGTVANRDESRGCSCIAEMRAVETIKDGKPSTPFMRFGDTIKIEMLDAAGHSIFGAIEQKVVKYGG